MTVNTTIVNRVIDVYLRRLDALLVKSSSRLWDLEVLSSSGSTDDKLIKMIDLARHGDLLRNCTDLQIRILFLAIGGRAFVPRFKKVGFCMLPMTGRSRKLTSGEVARLLGLSDNQYRHQLSQARFRVEEAIKRRLCQN